jgi:RIP metalloprotease RseP
MIRFGFYTGHLTLHIHDYLFSLFGGGFPLLFRCFSSFDFVGKSLLLASKTSVVQAQQQVSDIISTIRGTPEGESVVIQITRPGADSLKEVSIQPRRAATTVNPNEVSSKKSSTTFTQKATITTSTSSSLPPSIGVYLSPNVLKVEKLQNKDPVIAAQLAWQYLCDIYSQTLNGILTLLSNFVVGNGPPPGQAISGPIGLIKQGSTVVATKDWTAVLLFAAALSVNLGVINALPLPALDGGQLVFVIAEAITGKKVNQRLQEGITSIAVLFLLWVSVSAAVGDVGNILSGR